MVIQAKELNTSELYYKIPQAFNYPPYDKLSLRAEKLYGVILWRLRGSIKNGFVDDFGVYCNFSVKELEPILKCSNRVVIKAKKELADAGLLVEKRRFNASNKIYLEHPVNDETSLSVMTNGHISNDETSLSEMTNGHTIESYIYRVNNKELDKEIDSTAVGGAVAENSSLIKETEQEPDGQQHQQSIFDEIQENFGRVLWPIEIETLNHLLAENNIELVREALKRAVLNGKPSINYMDGILRSWRMKNITTPLEAQAEIDNAKNKTGNSNPYMSDDEVRSMQEKYGF